MVRTQIQLPDEVYARAKRFCRAREMPFAELVRRGVELLLDVYPRPEDTPGEWAVPVAPRPLGWRGFSGQQLKDLAQLGTTEAGLLSVVEGAPGEDAQH
jgi:hypothetical protein